MSQFTFLNGRAPTFSRGLLWAALSDTAVLQRETATSDSGGGASYAWSNAGTAACRIDPLTTTPGSRLTGGQIDERSTHVVTIPPGLTVGTGDRVVITNRGTYEVTGIRNRTGAVSNAFEVFQVF